VAASALGLALLRQVAGLVPPRRQLAHAHRAVLRLDAAATTHVLGYDLRKRVRAAVVHRHGVWIMPLPLRYSDAELGSGEHGRRGPPLRILRRPRPHVAEVRACCREGIREVCACGGGALLLLPP